jgi:hypothetical protein
MKQTAQEQIKQMRSVLVPQGTAPIVRLFTRDCCYIPVEDVTEAIDYLSGQLPIKVMLGEPVNPLEKLAILLLKDSAYIED